MAALNRFSVLEFLVLRSSREIVARPIAKPSAIRLAPPRTKITRGDR